MLPPRSPHWQRSDWSRGRFREQWLEFYLKNEQNTDDGVVDGFRRRQQLGYAGGFGGPD